MVSIQTEEIELASEMVQSIAKFFNVPHLASTCEFPREFDKFEQLVHLTEAHQVTRQQMTADVAEKIDLIGTLLVRAEDQRLMGCWGTAKQMYTELLYTNRDLLTGYQSRICEHRTLSDCQKRLNQFIEQASSLRVGKFKTKVVSLCHQALKTNNLGTLFKVVRTGVE
ncbi:Bardet-Biedl syndrome 2 protein [Paragonimus westermani]|uniref:Bardet-Biedl syndrome 2 protein n=1 Tax=Paragonimus westermani TaxID=34504 RepID=A0A5J4NBE1_9TREM|nr:Bardet-Biedl syndrome 2 protein [Paragonimus westermani]